MSPTSHRPGDSCNQTGLVIGNSIEFDELFIGQNDRHDASIVSIKTGGKHHAIEQQCRKAACSVQSQPLVKQRLEYVPVIFGKELLHKTHFDSIDEQKPKLEGLHKAHRCFGHAMLLAAGLYTQGRQTRGIGTPHIRCPNICGVHDPGPSELGRWSMRGVASLDNVNLDLRRGLNAAPAGASPPESCPTSRSELVSSGGHYGLPRGPRIVTRGRPISDAASERVLDVLGTYKGQGCSGCRARFIHFESPQPTPIKSTWIIPRKASSQRPLRQTHFGPVVAKSFELRHSGISFRC